MKTKRETRSGCKDDLLIGRSGTKRLIGWRGFLRAPKLVDGLVRFVFDAGRELNWGIESRERGRDWLRRPGEDAEEGKKRAALDADCSSTVSVVVGVEDFVKVEGKLEVGRDEQRMRDGQKSASTEYEDEEVQAQHKTRGIVQHR